MNSPLRIDPNQRFTCSQCGRCCHRSEVAVTKVEIESYRRRNAAAWFRESDDTAEGAALDPFEPFREFPGLFRIRKRADGACGFLSAENRCRIHEELGADRKPLTCRMFPYNFHAAPDAVVVMASFACPTIVANEGRPVDTGKLEALRQEWGGARATGGRELVRGRPIDGRSLGILRDNLLAILNRDVPDLRENVRRIARALDDLTRSRVVNLSADDFAEYVALTLPYAAAKDDPPAPRGPGLPRRSPGAKAGLPRRSAGAKAGRIGRLLQYGFLFVSVATRLELEQRGRSRFSLRLARLRLLAHFHGLAPGVGRVNVRALARQSVDINAPGIRPIVFHYLRSSLEALGARPRPVVDDFAIAVSSLNAACSVAVMNAEAAARPIDRQIFSEALMEAADLSRAVDAGFLGWALPRLASGVEALNVLSAPIPNP